MNAANTREAAAAAVLRDIAHQLVTLVALLRPVCVPDQDEQAAIIDAAAALASVTGMLADRAARTLEHGPCFQTSDEWLLTSAVRDALQVLEAKQ